MKPPPVKRSYSKIPVWIVEDHHEVVRHIYRAIGSRHIPLKDVKMVHLDSHPDLLIPVSMAAHTVFDKEALFSELSIENWIMPMVYAGHVSHVAWLHPYWAQQIREGEHEMCVGRDSSTNTIRVTSTDDYFLSDALYVPPEQLEDGKPFRLSVVRVDPAHTSDTRNQENSQQNTEKKSKVDPEVGSSGSCSDGSQAAGGSSSTPEIPSAAKASDSISLLSELKQDDPYILDIDLDFFSCKNPFKEMYTQDEYCILQELYSFERPREDEDEELLCECVERRTRQLEDLEAAFADLLEDDSELTVERLAHKLGMKSFVKLVCSLKSRNKSPDYEMVHQAGLTCDYSELPHHVSSEAEIQQLMLAVHSVLQPLPKPTLITMSRSSLDEYCPPAQVDSIQSNILNVLETLFGSLDVHKEYEEASGENALQAS
ncbi:UPF0489 protein C5orf22 homolog [Silurus meridionalis]|uniref:Uncharacterized protein n=2 Tax=Silurus TaxID=94992 RepID=A0A8T0AMA9_SILME|nr:UPF0489 protein C5orf22 homolog [Silurus meridionalis]KAF7692867.1 hypothetical protein HF521_010477 [Silurus meridionalis]KAI5093152.1 UPF0489 protein C5orf22-like [Silurus meridionalis]KAI5616943.1 UPF0489 protein C5orf22-like [Silurus asotus]